MERAKQILQRDFVGAGGNGRRPGVLFEPRGGNFNLRLVRSGDVAGLLAYGGDVGLLAHRFGGAPEDSRVRLQLNGGDVGARDPEIEQPPCVAEARLGRHESRVGGRAAAGALAADFEQLTHCGHGIVTAVKKGIAQDRAAAVFEIDFGREQRKRGVREFAGDELLRLRKIHVAFRGQQIPVVEERELPRIFEREFWRGLKFRSRQRHPATQAGQTDPGEEQLGAGGS